MMKRPFRQTFSQFSRGPLKDATSFTYRSDGSGRDSYVLKNSGGLVNEYGHTHRHDINFKAQLRFNPAQVLPN